MSCPFNEEQLAQLTSFVDLCKTQPQILHHPKLAFFKDFLGSLGVTIPSASFGAKSFKPSGDNNATNDGADTNAQESSDEELLDESDVELDLDGVIEADVLDSSQIMGDNSKEPTDEERDQCDEKRSLAMKAFSEQQYDKAIKLYTEAIQLHPQSAILFAKRGQVYLKLNKPNACIKDCTHALELNCDSAAAYKFRGLAYRLLGNFEEASHDLCESLKIDYDDQTNEWLNEVKPNAEKLRQHKLSMQRKKEEKAHREKVQRAQKAQEARASAARAQSQAGFGGQGAPGGIPDLSDTSSIIDELAAAFADPDISAALQDISKNPASLAKYMKDPKIAAFIERFPADRDLGGFTGADGPKGTGPKPPTDDDVGLD